MLRIVQLASRYLMVGILFAATGCGGDERGLVQVRGIVEYDGVSVPTGYVTFVPSEPGRASKGRIQSDGTYQLSTYKQGDGAPVGEYRVKIEAFEQTGQTGEYGNYDPNNPPERNWFIPQRYASVSSSGLSATVEPVSSQKIDFIMPAK